MMGIKHLSGEVLDYFHPYLRMEGDTASFRYSLSNGGPRDERWGPSSGTIPSTDGLWIASRSPHKLTGELFIGYSARELLCFCHFHSSYLQGTLPIAFAALGLVPRKTQIDFLGKQFPNARVHTIFEAGPLGAVADCSVALWMQGSEAMFILEGYDIRSTYRGKTEALEVRSMSLNRFKLKHGIKSPVRTHKPKYPYLDFYQQASSILAGQP